MKPDIPAPGGRWAALGYTETFTGAVADYGLAANYKALGRGLGVSPGGITITKGGLYLVLLYGYTSNQAAGARAEVSLKQDGSLLIVSRLYVSNAGGLDENTVHSVFYLPGGARLNISRYHSDTGSGRAVNGEVFVQELAQ